MSRCGTEGISRRGNSDLNVNTRKNIQILLAVIVGLLSPVMQAAEAQSNPYVGAQQGLWFQSVSTDKARYDPLGAVQFTVAFKQQVAGKTLVAAYEHLDSLVGSDTLQVQNADSVSWVWQVPQTDYRGYMIQLYLIDSGTLLDYSDIALDVSSDWSKFPRYGFLSSYPNMSQSSIDSTITVLNRYHINGLQFYDWQYKHNEPLAGTVQSPSPTWNDIANRTNYLSTVEGYIDAAHQRGMKAMNYNLLYGAYANAYQDGVNTSWSLYQDTNHQSRLFYALPSGWASNLYIMDPSNSDWKNYIFAQERKVFLAIPFDGWHVDQLGYLGSSWNYAGQPVDVAGSFSSFLTDARSQLNVDLVMNAVGQYGQSQIASTNVDFLYTEVWDPDSTYGDLTQIIGDNSTYSNNRLRTVLAAYMDYNLSGGYFNTPGVLLTDAVIFASGGDHLELGEHMLSNEYFPTAKLQMSPSLQQALVHYYDFMVAYENLLRDGERAAFLPVSGEMGSASISLTSQPALGSLWNSVTMKDSLVVLNLVNFLKANSMAWRDRYGTQAAPDTLSDLTFSFVSGSKIVKIWTASPDFYGGSPVNLPFTQSGTSVSFTVPDLLYWGMVVIQFDTTVSSIRSGRNELPGSFSLGQNYPNPFNPQTTIGYNVPFGSNVKIDVYNVLGQKVATLVDGFVSGGFHEITFDGSRVSSGLYICTMRADRYFSSMKMVLMK